MKMASLEFPNNLSGLDDAKAVADPKNVIIFPDRIVVQTPPDYQPDDSDSTRYLGLQEFRERFTDTELTGISASEDPLVRKALMKITTRDDRRVPFSEETRAVLNHMVSIGLLASDRPEKLLE